MLIGASGLKLVAVDIIATVSAIVDLRHRQPAMPQQPPLYEG